MKRYIRSSTNIKNGSYMLSKTGEITPVYFHAPSTTYESRGIYHLCPTDADFLVSQKQISKEDGIVIMKACFVEYLKDNGADDAHEITSSDLNKFADYGDLLGVPWLYAEAMNCEGQVVGQLVNDSKSFKSLNDKWYKWLKNNYVKITVNNNKTEFRIGSDDNTDWNDVIIDDFILSSDLQKNSNMKYNILRESGKGYKAYFENASLNDILEDDKVVLSDEDIMSSDLRRGSIMITGNYSYRQASTIPIEYRKYYKIDAEADPEEDAELSEEFAHYGLDYICPVAAKSRYLATFSDNGIDLASVCQNYRGEFGVYAFRGDRAVDVMDIIDRIFNR